MKKLLLLFYFVLLSLPVLNAQSSVLSKESATLIFVRHAEKADDGTRNPPLTKEGEARAKRIMEMIKRTYKNINAVYSTPYKRTELTAEPTANEFDLTVQEYDPRAPNVFVKSLLKEHRGEVVLIVGHSNTTPFLVNLVLGEEKFKQLDESAYDEVFIVNSTEVGKGKVEVKTSASKNN
ncbi:MAG: phosphoglycerate mutase family protein [Balneola sp.]